MSVEMRAELVMAIRGYDCEEKEFQDHGIDFTASDEESDEKILLRVITNPKSNSGVVGVDAVAKMAEVIKQEDYDKGILVSERFSGAARNEMRRKGIQMISERYMPSFTPQKLYLTIQDCMDSLCKTKCGRIPEKEADCEGRDSDGNYLCRIRLVSDNASFHFQRAWTDLLGEDLKQLLTLQRSIGRQNDGDNKNV